MDSSCGSGRGRHLQADPCPELTSAGSGSTQGEDCQADPTPRPSRLGGSLPRPPAASVLFPSNHRHPRTSLSSESDPSEPWPAGRTPTLGQQVTWGTGEIRELALNTLSAGICLEQGGGDPGHAGNRGPRRLEGTSSGPGQAPSASSQQPQAVGTTMAPLRAAGCPPPREVCLGAPSWAPGSRHHGRAPGPTMQPPQRTGGGSPGQLPTPERLSPNQSPSTGPVLP